MGGAGGANLSTENSAGSIQGPAGRFPRRSLTLKVVHQVRLRSVNKSTSWCESSCGVDQGAASEFIPKVDSSPPVCRGPVNPLRNRSERNSLNQETIFRDFNQSANETECLFVSRRNFEQSKRRFLRRRNGWGFWYFFRNVRRSGFGRNTLNRSFIRGAVVRAFQGSTC